MVEKAGCELLYLPPYSPNLNATEEAFSNIKGILRKPEGHARKVLVLALGLALSSIIEKDARGFFDHCKSKRRFDRYDKRY